LTLDFGTPIGLGPLISVLAGLHAICGLLGSRHRWRHHSQSRAQHAAGPENRVTHDFSPQTALGSRCRRQESLLHGKVGRNYPVCLGKVVHDGG
jgi:hypothetical protein